ncbi:MAG: hypothetical protein ABI383_05580 [Acidobacteriaceae bacterium]
MKRAALVIAFVAAVTSVAVGKDRAPVPAIITNARFVAILPLTADSRADWFNSINVNPDDRAAADAIFAALQKWHRYQYTLNPRDADIVIAVRAGRRAEVNGGVALPDANIHIGDPRTEGSSRGNGPDSEDPNSRIRPAIGVDTGPAEDTMAVFAGHDTDHPALWIREQRDGLQGKLPLFESFKKDVEKSDPTPSKKP